MKQLDRRLQVLEARIGAGQTPYPIHGLREATLVEIDRHGFNAKALSSPALKDIIDHTPPELLHV